MMFWSDNNFSVFIVANLWVDYSCFIMQDSGYSDVIIGFNWTCNSQLGIHIDFTTLKGFDILPNPNSDSEPSLELSATMSRTKRNSFWIII